MRSISLYTIFSMTASSKSVSSDSLENSMPTTSAGIPTSGASSGKTGITSPSATRGNKHARSRVRRISEAAVKPQRVPIQVLQEVGECWILDREVLRFLVVVKVPRAGQLSLQEHCQPVLFNIVDAAAYVWTGVCQLVQVHNRAILLSDCSYRFERGIITPATDH